MCLHFFGLAVRYSNGNLKQNAVPLIFNSTIAQIPNEAGAPTAVGAPALRCALPALVMPLFVGFITRCLALLRYICTTPLISITINTKNATKR